jgi:serine phosphatase RsbU (regulator of sigma subunit)
VGPAPRTTTSISFTPGQTLLLFTDGLLERRGEDLDVSKDRLRRACRVRPPGATDEDLDRLAAEMRDPTRDDDVALLAVRRLHQSP